MVAELDMVEVIDANGQKMQIGRAYANEYALAREQGIDYSNPVAVSNYRANSSCTSACIVKEFVVGGARDTVIEKSLSVGSAVLKAQSNNMLNMPGRILNKSVLFAKPISTTMDLIYFNDTLRASQSSCPSGAPN